MNSWIAGLVGFVVAGVVLLIIARLGILTQDRSVAATQQRALRTSQMNILQMIELDFQNIGSNYPSYDLLPENAIMELDTVGVDRAFRYVGQTRSRMPPDTVRYTWSVTGKKTIDRGTVDVYRVRRWINGLLTGESSGAITRFSIGLLDSGGLPVANFAEARQIQIGISMVSGLGESALLGETHWGSIVRPAALARLDYEKYLE